MLEMQYPNAFLFGARGGGVNIVSNRKEKGGAFFFVECISATDGICYLFREGVANSILR